MFLIRWLRKILALPLQWLGQLAAWFKTGLDVPLLTAAWRVSGDGRIAKMALAAIYLQQGAEASLAYALVWMQQHPRPEIAAMAGLMALDQGQMDTARQMLQAAQHLDKDDEGLLELLEWQVAVRSDDDHAVRDLTHRLEARRDLPPSLRRMVLCSILWDAVMERQFTEAASRARYLLSIEEVPEAHMALWATALEQGDLKEAQSHLSAAQMTPARKLYYQVFGNAAVGFRGQAEALLDRLRQTEPDMAAHAQHRLAGLGVVL